MIETSFYWGRRYVRYGLETVAQFNFKYSKGYSNFATIHARNIWENCACKGGRVLVLLLDKFRMSELFWGHFYRLKWT